MNVTKTLQNVVEILLLTIILWTNPGNFPVVALSFMIVFIPLAWRYIEFNGWHYAIFGLIFRPQVRKWLAWLGEQDATEKIDPDDGPWLPKWYIDYLVRLGPMVQFAAHQKKENMEASQLIEEAKEKKKRRRRKANYAKKQV
jgi:hypothetical protein